MHPFRRFKYYLSQQITYYLMFINIKDYSMFIKYYLIQVCLTLGWSSVVFALCLLIEKN